MGHAPPAIGDSQAARRWRLRGGSLAGTDEVFYARSQRHKEPSVCADHWGRFLEVQTRSLGLVTWEKWQLMMDLTPSTEEGAAQTWGTPTLNSGEVRA